MPKHESRLGLGVATAASLVILVIFAMVGFFPSTEKVQADPLDSPIVTITAACSQGGAAVSAVLVLENPTSTDHIYGLNYSVNDNETSIFLAQNLPIAAGESESFTESWTPATYHVLALDETSAYSYQEYVVGLCDQPTTSTTEAPTTTSTTEAPTTTSTTEAPTTTSTNSGNAPTSGATPTTVARTSPTTAAVAAVSTQPAFTG